MLYYPRSGNFFPCLGVAKRFRTVDTELRISLIGNATICAKHRVPSDGHVPRLTGGVRRISQLAIRAQETPPCRRGVSHCGSLTYGSDLYDLPMAIFSLQSNVQNGSAVLYFSARFLRSFGKPLQPDVGTIVR